MVDNKQAIGQVQIDYETKHGPEGIAINIPFEQALGLIDKTHVIVPIEPTEEMQKAGWEAADGNVDFYDYGGWTGAGYYFEDKGPKEIWEAMLKAMIKDNK